MKKLDKNFLEKLKLIYSKDELEIIEKGFNVKRNTVFRINTSKTVFEALDELKKLGFKFKKINFLNNAFKILGSGEKRLAETRSFKEGYIYVQGITSQIPIEIITVNNPGRILDLTASPGGKTTQASNKFPQSQIFANELNKIRLEKLKYTITKQGSTNIETLNNDARELYKLFEKGTFDVIIADLPCSAEGRINLNNEKTYKYLEKSGINKRNYKLQQNILEKTIPLLKIGGELIYSTCTLDPLENEGIVNDLLFKFPELEIQDISDFFSQKGLKKISKQGITKYKKKIFKPEVSKSYRILPSESTEGFFVAKLKKVK